MLETDSINSPRSPYNINLVKSKNETRAELISFEAGRANTVSLKDNELSSAIGGYKVSQEPPKALKKLEHERNKGVLQDKKLTLPSRRTI